MKVELIELRGYVPNETEPVVQYFTWNERRTAAEIGRVWRKRGWCPTLRAKSYNGCFMSLNSTLDVAKAA